MIWRKFQEANTKVAEAISKKAAKDRNMDLAHDMPEFWVYKAPGGEGKGVVVSCWEPSFRERLSVLLFGRVWLTFYGEHQPPAGIDAVRNIFNHTSGGKKK